MEHPPTGLDPPPGPGEEFVYIVNPNPDVSDALSYGIVKIKRDLQEKDSANSYNCEYNADSSSKFLRSDSAEKRRKVELPKELSNNVIVLNCESSAEGGTCDVYLVGTIHVSKKSRREVEAVIGYLKPQVVFLELCSIRTPMLLPQTLKVPTMGDMIEMWKEKHTLFDILFCLFVAKFASKLGVFPGSEFRVAYEEAMKYGGKVVVGDRPIEITLRRIWEKMPIWEKTKILWSLLYGAVLLSSPEIFKKKINFSSYLISSSIISRCLPRPKEFKKKLKVKDEDKILLLLKELGKEFPILNETLIHERDQYMSSALLKVARNHNSVVAVVGMGHLNGIKRHWKQPVCINDLMENPTKQRTVRKKFLVPLGVSAAGVAIISGIYFVSQKLLSTKNS